MRPLLYRSVTGHNRAFDLSVVVSQADFEREQSVTPDEVSSLSLPRSETAQKGQGFANVFQGEVDLPLSLLFPVFLPLFHIPLLFLVSSQ